MAAIAKPQIGVVTNVGYAHVEAFDSVEGIAAAKRELIEALPSDGVAVLNADDARVIGFRESHTGKVVTYGTAAPADVQAEDLEFGPYGAGFTVDGVHFNTRLTGRHAVSNILAGLAVASSFAIPFGDLVPAIAEIAGVE